tara:strand:+ start:6431 stop:6940 length:510 start_codon:yes stop_codon:yes gene_type:complete
MAIRDTSRIKIRFFAQTTSPTGTSAIPDSVDATSNVYACVTDGPTWSGFTRGDVETTCSNTTLDAWGNLIRTFQSGKIVDMGTVTFTVDWNPDDTNGGREFAAFMDGRSGDLLIEFPADVGETVGPYLTLTGYCNKFTPKGTVLSDDQSSRSLAELVYRISAIDVTGPV